MMKVPFARPSCTGNELKYVREVLDSGWLTTGSRTLDFEAAFSDAVGSRFALAVNSCTAALHLACEACGIGPGSRVVVPTLTFTATAEVVRYLGGEVVLADVDPRTGMLTPQILEQLLETEKDVSAVIPVHFGGRAAHMLQCGEDKGLLDVCVEHGIKVIEDAAHAFPSRYECGTQQVVGGLDGTVSCFSFYANKTITTGEGGMLATNDPDIAERVRRMRLHGINRDAWNRFTTETASWEYDVIAPGFKYNMPDVAAAIGLAQLEQAEKFRSERQSVAEIYFQRFANLPGLMLPEKPASPDGHSWHLYPIVLDGFDMCTRNEFVAALNERGIGTSVHYKPLHRMSYWSEVCASEPDRYPGAEKWWAGCFSLPIFPGMSSMEVDAVCNAVCEIAVTVPST